MPQALTEADNSDYAIVDVGQIAWFSIDLHGTFDSGKVTTTICTDNSDTYHAYMPDGAAAEWDAATNVVVRDGSCKLKFTVSGGSGSESINLAVRGPNILSIESVAVA